MSGADLKYVGERTAGGLHVYVVEAGVLIRPLSPRLDLFNHSPLGFECGYQGSGPAQLALAILADHLATRADEILAACFAGCESDEVDLRRTSLADRVAVHLHQAFKASVIAKLPRDRAFALTSAEVSSAIAELCAKNRGGA